MPEKESGREREGSGITSRGSRLPTPSSAIYPCSGSGTPNLSRPASSRVNTAASRRSITRSARKSRQRRDGLLISERLSAGARDGSVEYGGADWENARRQAANEFLDLGGGTIDIYNDNGWDTDLEEESQVQPRGAETSLDDDPSKTIYMEACKTNGVVPASYFIRHIHDEHLDMKHHGLAAAGVKPLAIALVSNTMVLSLNLEDNWLDNEGGVFLCNMLKENCYIAQLDLSNNRLGLEFAHNFADVLMNNSTLTHITLTGNLLDDAAAVHLAEAIAITSKVEYLNLSKNRLGVGAGVALGPAISENSSLQALDLSWNSIRCKGATAIGQGLKHNVLIKSLNLSWNGFGLEGGKALAEALKLNSTLLELDITNNRLTVEAAVLLGKGLTQNETLKVLKMGQNPFQSAGCYGVCASLLRSPNSALRQLDFKDITVNGDFDDLLVKVKAQLPHLAVHHGGDPIADKPKVIVHAVTRLKNYMEKRNMPANELFKDSEHTMSVDRQLFVQTVQSIGLKLSADDMVELLDCLDINNNGLIDYSELVSGRTESREKETKD